MIISPPFLREKDASGFRLRQSFLDGLIEYLCRQIQVIC